MKVKFGLFNVVMAPFSFENGKYTYDTPVKVPGAVNLSLDPAGNSTEFHADNVKYFVGSTNDGYSGDFELAMVTDEMREKIFGENKDSAGAFFESSEDEVKPFALGFQIKGDKKDRKFWYYNCVTTRPKTEAKTQEANKEPNTDTLTLTAMPRETDKKVRVFLSPSDSNTEAYEKFFDKVYEALQTL